MIGVLGGMGPAATVDFLNKMICLTPVRVDQEHLPVIVSGVPQIPDRSAAILAGGPDPLPRLLAGIEFLNDGGAGLIAIPCNTAHHWYDQLSARSRAPILHIAKVCVAALAPERSEKVAVFATSGTLASGFYGRELERRGIASLRIGDKVQMAVNACITHVKAGDLRAAGEQLKLAADGAAAGGATTVIMACTELPIAAEKAGPLPVRAVDSSLQLAAAAVRYGMEQGWNQPGMCGAVAPHGGRD